MRVWYTFVDIYRGKVAAFTILCEQYQPSLKRDPACNEVSTKYPLQWAPLTKKPHYNLFDYNEYPLTQRVELQRVPGCNEQISLHQNH